MYSFDYTSLILATYWIQSTFSISLLKSNPLLSMNSEPEQDVADFIIAKGYIPNDKDLPRPKIVKNSDNDITYLLSKLSDGELIKLLSDQPNKKEYTMNDLLKINLNTKRNTKANLTLKSDRNSKNDDLLNAKVISVPSEMKRVPIIAHKRQPNNAFFRLENKEIDPFAVSKNAASDYRAVQKLNNLLYSQPTETELEYHTDIDEEKKEMLFDVLIAQLKALCCKRNKTLKRNVESKLKIKNLLNYILQEMVSKNYVSELNTKQFAVPNEYMFLIFNDEIISTRNDNGNLISVDPESLGKNSSAMLLGPLSIPLSDAQLKLVMIRISNELAKMEYLPLLQQISDGTLSNEHKDLIDSIIRGPHTRRYIKPHRCNHQSRLSAVYGGPKWLICTGYLNLNKPSIYD